MSTTYTLDEQIAELKRELGLRPRVYERWVRDGKMTQQQADERIGRMRAALVTLQAVQRRGRAEAAHQEQARPRPRRRRAATTARSDRHCEHDRIAGRRAWTRSPDVPAHRRSVQRCAGRQAFCAVCEIAQFRCGAMLSAALRCAPSTHRPSSFPTRSRNGRSDA